MNTTLRTLLLPLLALGLSAPVAAQTADTQQAPPATAGPVVYDPEIVATYPHDPEAFTQGLIWHDGALYESTGREGSGVRRVALGSGEVEASRPLPAGQFGEGLTLWGDTLLSITWTSGVLHRWNAETLELLRSDDFPYEGWGLTHDGESLIATDGSDKLRFLDPDTLELRREVSVTLGGKPLTELNELEYVDGLVFANIWHTGFIVGIDPATGAVAKVVDLRPLVDANTGADREAVLNGIAHDPATGRWFVTGKLWSNLYEIRLVEREGATASSR